MCRCPFGRMDNKSARDELFRVTAVGKAKLIVDKVLPMSVVSKDHQHLSNRGTMGKVILTP